MKVLGLSSNYHDASAALVIDGQVVAASAEERFTLQKHDPSFPHLSARYCLEQAGIRAEDLDYVAYHEDPESKFSRTLSSAFAKFPFSRRTFCKSMHEAMTSGLWIRHSISRSLGLSPGKILFVPHHFSHAAHAFLTSPFAEAAILTIDAVGEWTCTGSFEGYTEGGTRRLRPVDLVPFPHSLGLVYSAFTAFLGFKVNDGECSTMALAAFGRPRFADTVRQVIRGCTDGTYEIDISYFDFSQWESIPITAKFVAAFGAPRPYQSPLPFDCLSDAPASAEADLQRYADIAASLQLVLEERVLALARKVRQDTGRKNLCLAGGVALNCVANGKLIESGIFENVYIPPDPGDGGGAMGAALYAGLKDLRAAPEKRKSSFTPYFGKAYGEDELLEMLPHLKTELWAPYSRRRMGGSPPGPFRLKVKKFGSLEELTAATVERLLAGQAVGWCQGRFENGPRALGNRSILLDPANIEAARHLSARIKRRSSFRPYACSLAERDAERVFVRPAPDLPSKWMLSSRLVKPEFRAPLRAALHVDGSTRPQICSPEDNPRFFALLSAFGQARGLAALLNTSFNEAGFPLVSSPVEALTMFARTELPALVLNDTILSKEYQT